MTQGSSRNADPALRQTRETATSPALFDAVACTLYSCAEDQTTAAPTHRRIQSRLPLPVRPRPDDAAATLSCRQPSMLYVRIHPVNSTCTVWAANQNDAALKHDCMTPPHRLMPRQCILRPPLAQSGGGHYECLLERIPTRTNRLNRPQSPPNILDARRMELTRSMLIYYLRPSHCPPKNSIWGRTAPMHAL